MLVRIQPLTQINYNQFPQLSWQSNRFLICGSRVQISQGALFKRLNIFYLILLILRFLVCDRQRIYLALSSTWLGRHSFKMEKRVRVSLVLHIHKNCIIKMIIRLFIISGLCKNVKELERLLVCEDRKSLWRND